MNNLQRFTNPKFVFFLATIPFMLLCPLIISSLTTGFPYSVWKNNEKLRSFEQFFDYITLPEGVSQLGQTHSVIDEVNPDDDSKTKVKCDLASSKVVVSSLTQEEVSQLLLAEFQKTFDSEYAADFEETEIISESQLKVFPIFATDDNYENTDLNLNIKKDFKISNLDSTQNTYLVYMINYDVFESNDYRCR
jgi:hypothetical protein